MVVVFSSIRPHLQQRAIQKLDFTALSRFSQCSQSSQEVSKCLTKILPWTPEIENEAFFNNLHLYSQMLDRFPVKIKFLYFSFGRLSKEKTENLLKLGEGGKVQMSTIIFHESHLSWSSEVFIKLLKILQVQRVIFHFYNENLVNRLQHTDLSNIDFHFLTPPYIYDFFTLSTLKMAIFNCNFGPEDLNYLLKQWHNGSLNIRKLMFVYSEESFELGQDENLLSRIPREKMDTKDKIAVKGERFYVLQRGEEQLYLYIYETEFRILLVSDPNAVFNTSACCVQKP